LRLSNGARWCIILPLLCAGGASADIDVENGEAESFSLSAYARIRYTEFGGPLTVPDRTFTIESAGLSADFEIADALEGQLQVETVPGEVFLKDCFLRWSPLTWADLRAGQFKKPFCLNTMTSTWDLLSFDHAITDRELEDLLYSGRDIGAGLGLDPGMDFVPELTLGVFNGSGDPENQDDELQYAARMEVELPAGFALGADASMLRFGEPDPESVTGYSVSSRQNALGVDLSFGADVTHSLSAAFQGEYVLGDNWAEADVVHGAGAPSFRTWWAALGLALETDAPAVEEVSLSVCMASWKPDDALPAREDELSVSLGIDTGTPVSLVTAVLCHMPEDMPSEIDRTDYVLEMALDL